MSWRHEAVALALKVFFSVWVAMLALRYCGVIEHPEVNVSTFMLFGVFAVPFVMLLPLYVLGGRAQGGVKRQVESGCVDAYGRFYPAVLLLSVLYFVLIVLDKIVLGGVLSVGVTEARYAAMSEGPRNSVLGALSYFLAGAPALLVCLLISRRADRAGRDILGWAIALGGFAGFFLSGGRNSFVVSVVFVFFYVLLERKRLSRVGGRGGLLLPMWLKCLLVAGGGYVLYMFSERAAIRGTDLAGAMRSLQDNYNVIVYSPSWLGGAALQVYYCVVYLVFYLTHAPTYVSQYFDIGYSPLLMGRYGFSIFYRIFDLFSGTALVSEGFGQLIVSGVYLTLPGTLYVDFGWGGVFCGAVLLVGFTVFATSIALRSERGAGRLAASFALMLVSLSPVFSGFSVGNGLSIFLILLVLRFFGVRSRRAVTSFAN